MELSFPFSLPSNLYQVLVYKTYILPQLCHFWDILQRELASKDPYKANIGGIRLRFLKMQGDNK